VSLEKSVGYAINSKVSGFFGFSYPGRGPSVPSKEK
jgi:hypothetical protein